MPPGAGQLYRNVEETVDKFRLAIVGAEFVRRVAAADFFDEFSSQQLALAFAA